MSDNQNYLTKQSSAPTMSAQNSSSPSESLPQQDVSEGEWALNAYSPVFWCPYRGAACSEGSAVTTTASPCAFAKSQSGYFCQNMHGSSSFLDYTSRQVEHCQWYKHEYLPVAALLSSCSLVLLLYVSCWKVSKLERPKAKKIGTKELMKRPVDSDVENRPGEAGVSTGFVLNCCGTKLFVAKEGIQEAAAAAPPSNGGESSKSNESLASRAFSYISRISTLGKPKSLSTSSSNETAVMSSWKKIEWLAELHVMLMSLQVRRWSMNVFTPVLSHQPFALQCSTTADNQHTSRVSVHVVSALDVACLTSLWPRLIGHAAALAIHVSLWRLCLLTYTSFERANDVAVFDADRHELVPLLERHGADDDGPAAACPVLHVPLCLLVRIVLLSQCRPETATWSNAFVDVVLHVVCQRLPNDHRQRRGLDDGIPPLRRRRSRSHDAKGRLVYLMVRSVCLAVQL